LYSAREADEFWARWFIVLRVSFHNRDKKDTEGFAITMLREWKKAHPGVGDGVSWVLPS